MNPVCPDNCTYELPGVAYNSCVPKVQQSQVRRVFVAKANAAPFANWKLDTEWLARVNQTGTSGDDYIRALTVTGEKPSPANVTKKIDNGLLAQIGKDHTLNFTTYQVTDENYEFMRNSECGTLVRLFGYETMGGVLFGTNAGILVSLVMDSVLGGGDDDLETLTGSITWRSKFSPERVNPSPIFDTDFNLAGGDGDSFDTTLDFTADPSVTSAAVTGTIDATDATVKFKFNAISTPVGTPDNMVLHLGGSDVASIDFPADYLGAAFLYVDALGVNHTGIFTSGVVVLS